MCIWRVYTRRNKNNNQKLGGIVGGRLNNKKCIFLRGGGDWSTLFCCKGETLGSLCHSEFLSVWSDLLDLKLGKMDSHLEDLECSVETYREVSWEQGSQLSDIKTRHNGVTEIKTHVNDIRKNWSLTLTRDKASVEYIKVWTIITLQVGL